MCTVDVNTTQKHYGYVMIVKHEHKAIWEALRFDAAAISQGFPCIKKYLASHKELSISPQRKLQNPNKWQMIVDDMNSKSKPLKNSLCGNLWNMFWTSTLLNDFLWFFPLNMGHIPISWVVIPPKNLQTTQKILRKSLAELQFLFYGMH